MAKAKILISPGYGSDLVKFNPHLNKDDIYNIRTNKLIIDCIEKNKPYLGILRKIIGSEKYQEYFDTEFKIFEVDTNRIFIIHEHDGSESIEYCDESKQIFEIKE